MNYNFLIRYLFTIASFVFLGVNSTFGQMTAVSTDPTTENITSNPLGNYLKGPYSAAVLEGIWYNSAFSDHKADMHKAMYWFAEAAKEGSLDGQALLGTFYLYGHGVASDYSKAYSLIKPAADQGSLVAQTYLAQMYINGWAVEKSYPKALNLLSSVGDRYSFALTLTGMMYIFELGVPRDMEKGLALLNTAANQGDPYAYVLLGETYLWGVGTAVNRPVAIMWLQKGADRDQRAALFYLAEVYQHGVGLKANPQKAAGLMLRSAMLGYSMAQLEVGYLYHKGLGIDLNDVEAVYWLRRAEAMGKSSRGLADRIAQTLTPEQNHTIQMRLSSTDM